MPAPGYLTGANNPKHHKNEMKKLLLSLLGVAIALPALARDFTYTHEGQTITYTVIDEDAKTCQTKEGTFRFEPGNDVSGALVLPEHPKDGDIEYTLTSIAPYSFVMCKELTSVTIPESVTKICDYAFNSCEGLRSLTLPDAVTLIGNYAFGVCKELTSIRIPDSVTEIGYQAFVYCYGLGKIYLPELSKWIAIDKAGGMMQMFPETATFFMGNVEIDPKHIFEEEDYVIQESVTKIGAYTFYDCEDLKSVTIPASVTEIGSYAFCHCHGIESIDLPESITGIGNQAFSYCTGLTSVRIPSSIKSIGAEVFSGCSSLTAVYLPDIVTWISADKSTKMFGVGMTKPQLYMNGEKVDFQVLFSGNYVIPEAVKKIGAYTFYGCEELNTVEIPNSVTQIGDRAFGSCKGLTEVTIPNSVTEIGEYLFFNCFNLASVELSNSITTISWGMFESCTSLAAVKLPESITVISNRAFDNCSSLSSITIPNSVTIIEPMAFSFCSELSDVVIGKSVSEIGIYAFEGANALKNITVKAPVPPTASDTAFSSDTYETATLRVPAGSADSYRECTPWNMFTSMETTDDEGRLESVESETAHGVTEIYNLNGTRVAGSMDRLPDGVYVVRRGAKVTKVRI